MNINKSGDPLGFARSRRYRVIGTLSVFLVLTLAYVGFRLALQNQARRDVDKIMQDVSNGLTHVAFNCDDPAAEPCSALAETGVVNDSPCEVLIPFLHEARKAIDDHPRADTDVRIAAWRNIEERVVKRCPSHVRLFGPPAVTTEIPDEADRAGPSVTRRSSSRHHRHPAGVGSARDEGTNPRRGE
jgi:hypothetical protein